MSLPAGPSGVGDVSRWTRYSWIGPEPRTGISPKNGIRWPTISDLRRVALRSPRVMNSNSARKTFATSLSGGGLPGAGAQLRRRHGGREVAEDLAQEAFVRAISTPAQVRNPRTAPMTQGSPTRCRAAPASRARRSSATRAISVRRRTPAATCTPPGLTGCTELSVRLALALADDGSQPFRDVIDRRDRREVRDAVTA